MRHTNVDGNCSRCGEQWPCMDERMRPAREAITRATRGTPSAPVGVWISGAQWAGAVAAAESLARRSVADKG